MRRIAILTSGGDAPGMNTAIRAAVKMAQYKGMEVYGIRRGYHGMLMDEIFLIDGRFLSGIIEKGGTALLTARCPEFKDPKYRAIAAENLKRRGIEGLIVIGGDGSYRGADLLSKEHGIKVVGLPGTIDNDIIGTDYTIGFDTCLNTILDAISKLRDTATSHERTILVEVMGRRAGDLAVHSCICGGGDGILIPEVENSIEMLAFQIKQRRNTGRLHDIVLVAEGVGNIFDVEKELKEKVTTEVRTVILGHIQRGGTPSGRDRMLATQMAVKAVELLEAGEGGIMVGVERGDVVTHPISYAWEGTKRNNILDLYRIADIFSR
ncbi:MULTISPECIES: 6-phosphofructokinase [Fusobacterium]|uniref:6-phosphofructokinase n=1 Tax=Fusobacterium TaxID=848 RepID=UPI001476EEFD|nr:MULTISPECIES: 6-phosphofructokinase [Fusobacterium]NME36583.1 6-phosphofructokinase [Fusobacterium sp. FSA-380-WT-3A]